MQLAQFSVGPQTPLGQPGQKPQSIGHVRQLSVALHVPLGHCGQFPQSVPQL